MDLTSEKSHAFPRTLGAVLFFIGVLLGVVFLGYAVWADIEATLFDPSLDADESLRSLKCPLILTTGESGTVSASFHNDSERSIRPYVRAHISERLVTLMREEMELITIPAGKSEARSWEIKYDDAVYERFVLVRVTQNAYFPIPSRSGTCGVLVLNIPFLSGGTIAALITALIAVCIYFGMRLWLKYNQPQLGRVKTITQGFVWLTIVLAVGILVAFLGWWFASAFLFVLTLMLLMVVSTYVFLTA